MNMFVNALAIDIVWNGVVVGALAGIMLGDGIGIDVVADIVIGLECAVCDVDGVSESGVDVLADVSVSVLVAVMTLLEFAKPVLCAESTLCCCTMSTCGPMTALDCACLWQVWMPSRHVCCTFALPVPPQFPNQEPPRPQQLSLPDLSMVPHLGHTEQRVVVVAGTGMCIWGIIPRQNRETS